MLRGIRVEIKAHCNEKETIPLPISLQFLSSKETLNPQKPYVHVSPNFGHLRGCQSPHFTERAQEKYVIFSAPLSKLVTESDPGKSCLAIWAATAYCRGSGHSGAAPSSEHSSQPPLSPAGEAWALESPPWEELWELLHWKNQVIAPLR